MKENRRNTLPPVYNPARLREKPVPALVLAAHNNTHEADDIDGDDDGPQTDVSNSNLRNSDSTVNDETSTAADDNANNDPQNDAANAIDSLVNVTVNGEDSILTGQHKADSDVLNISAVSPRFNHSLSVSNEVSTSASQQDTQENSVDVVPPIEMAMKQEPIFAVMNDQDANAVEAYLNNSYEQCGSDDDVFIHKSDYIPAPVTEQSKSTVKYQVKQSDIVSGTKPFAIDVSIYLPLKLEFHKAFNLDVFVIMDFHFLDISPKLVPAPILCSVKKNGSKSHFRNVL